MAKPILVCYLPEVHLERKEIITNNLKDSAPDWNVIVVYASNITKIKFEVHSELDPFIKNELELTNS